MKLRTITLAVLALGGSVASAGTSLGTLQDLINDGATGITVGDKQFYNFSYMGSNNDGANVAPTPAQINVVQAPGSDLGLEFQFNWNSSNGQNLDSAIRFTVHVLDSKALITGLGLHFDGSATGNTSLLTNASVTETAADLNNNPLGVISVFNAGSNFTSRNRNDALLDLGAGVKDLMLTKDITVHSAASETGGTATISLVDNTFRQSGNTVVPPGTVVPIPPAAWTGITTLGLIGAASMKRKLRTLIGA